MVAAEQDETEVPRSETGDAARYARVQMNRYCYKVCGGRNNPWGR